ncbi:hypothetical protein ABPG72_015718 [Tetrahymena utriculariae]
MKIKTLQIQQVFLNKKHQTREEIIINVIIIKRINNEQKYIIAPNGQLKKIILFINNQQHKQIFSYQFTITFNQKDIQLAKKLNNKQVNKQINQLIIEQTNSQQFFTFDQFIQIIYKFEYVQNIIFNHNGFSKHNSNHRIQNNINYLYFLQSLYCLFNIYKLQCNQFIKHFQFQYIQILSSKNSNIYHTLSTPQLV